MPARSTTRRRPPRGLPRSSSSRCSPACGSPRPRASTTSMAWSKRPSGRSGCATASSPIRTGCRRRWRRFSTRKFLDGEAREDRSAARRRRWPPAARGAATPSGWGRPTPSGLVVSYIQSIYWEFGSGCVLPATGVLMQNRGASFSLDPEVPQCAGARPCCRSTPSIRRSRCCATAASWPTAPWGARASRRPRPRCSPAMCSTASRSPRRSTGRAGCSAAPGGRPSPTCAWRTASTAT